jgi:hypothetical protein
MAKISMTVPKTEAEINYYARFGGLAKVLRIVSFLFLIVWAAADFMGLTLLILPQFKGISYTLSGIILFVSHLVLYFSAKAIGYDAQDGSGKLETGWFFLLPVSITMLMLALSVIGFRQLSESYLVHTPQYQDDAPVVAGRNAQNAGYQNQFVSDSNRLAARYRLITNATRDSFNAAIGKAQRQRTYDDFDRRRVAGIVSAKRNDREAAIATLELKQSNELQDLSATLSSNVKSLEKGYQAKAGIIASHNQTEKAKRDSDLASVEQNSFQFSFAMCALFWICTMIGCRIDTKSGIQPIHDYTQSDGHDVMSVVEYVVADIMKSHINNIFVSAHHRWAVDYKHLPTQRIITAQEQPNDEPPPPNEGAPIVEPPPIVPPNAPAPPDGGGDNGNNGGGQGPAVPPVVAVPSNEVVEAQALSKWQVEATLPLKEIKNFKVIEILSNNPIDGIDDISWSAALMDINPMIVFYTNGNFIIHRDDEPKVIGLATSYMKPRNQSPPPPIETVKQSDLDFELGVPHQTGCAGGVEGVPHHNAQNAYSTLDEKLDILRIKIQRESESQFLSAKTKKSTVAKRIFDCIDEATLTMRKGEIDARVLGDFKKVALDKLEIAKRHGFNYDCYEDFIAQLKHKEGDHV